MRTPLTSVADQSIKDAYQVYLVDPQSPSFSLQLYGQESSGMTTPYPNPARAISGIHLDIEIDSTDKNQIQAAIRRVEAVKGHLTQEIAKLKD